MEWDLAAGALTIQAGPLTDLFADPQGKARRLNAPGLVGALTGEGDFIFSAHVAVELAATFDAGALLLWAGERSWAKLCLELSPQGRPMVVSVVTRGVSDDCNSFTVDGRDVWLRVARLGSAFAFHASPDGVYWELVRQFALDSADEPAVGFLAQSPTGEGCRATFASIDYAAVRLADLRNGS